MGLNAKAQGAVPVPGFLFSFAQDRPVQDRPMPFPRRSDIPQLPPVTLQPLSVSLWGLSVTLQPSGSVQQILGWFFSPLLFTTILPRPALHPHPQPERFSRSLEHVRLQL